MLHFDLKLKQQNMNAFFIYVEKCIFIFYTEKCNLILKKDLEN